MKRASYRDRNYAFGQAMTTLRNATGLTQAAVAELLGVSRYAVGDWEAGDKYPNAEHLKHFITVAVQQKAFPAGHEAEEIRALWRLARQKVLLDEHWLTALLAPMSKTTIASAASPSQQIVARHRKQGARDHVFSLPSQSTSFIGRVDELAEIARILANPVCRLLTLLGPGGIGKTRLALEYANQQANTFADGVMFVPLASISTPNQIVSAIGKRLDISFSGQSEPTTELLNHLYDKEMLLVLDNFEHLIEGASLLSDIFSVAPSVRLLVTSRERLNLSAEWLFDVEGLSYPSGDTLGQISSLSMASLDAYSAVQLFLQRVMQVKPDFVSSETTLRTIISICERLAGLPLAIELAAASARLMPIAEIEYQIRSTLDILATSLRDVPSRHRSLRAAFDHSWNLMSESERTPFTRLSVFRGGFTVEAAEHVAMAPLPSLLTLVDKSLLRQTDSPVGPASLPRFFLLEPIREYALQKLDDAEAAALHRTHAIYYLGIAETAQAQWDSPTVDEAVEQLSKEYDNMRAALQWVVGAGGDTTIGLQLGGALWRYWAGGSAIKEGRAWLENLLDLDYDSADTIAMSARLRVLQGAAWIASDQHDFTLASHLFEQGALLRRALGENDTGSDLLLNEARQARVTGQYEKSVSLLEEALSRQRAQGDRGSSINAGIWLSLYELALLKREQGDFSRAAALYEECMALDDKIGDRMGTNLESLGLGYIARDQGDAVGVRKYSIPSLAFFRELSIHWAVGFCLNNLALAAYIDGDLSEAYKLIDESVALFRGLNNEAGLAEALISLGKVLQAQDDVAAAREALTEALRLAITDGPRLMVAAALEGLACAERQSEQETLAVQLLSTAQMLRTHMGTPVRPIDQHELDRTLAAARSALGESTFTEIWTNPQSLEEITTTILGPHVEE